MELAPDRPAPASGWLDAAHEHQLAARHHEVELLVAVLGYAMSHPPLDQADVAGFRVPGTGSTRPVQVAPLHGSGAPAVSARAVVELGVRLEMTTERARRLVADAVELAARLPRTWTALLAGSGQAWQARRVAQQTVGLCAEGAALVDRNLSPVLGRLRPARLDALVTEALARFEPEQHAARVADASEGRGVHIETTCGPDGLARIAAVVDLPDARDLEAALARRSAELMALGSTEPAQARRGRALGDLARSALGLVDGLAPPAAHRPGGVGPPAAHRPGGVGPPAAQRRDGVGPVVDGPVADGPARRGTRPSRQMVLYVHLGAGALRPGTGQAGEGQTGEGQTCEGQTSEGQTAEGQTGAARRGRGPGTGRGPHLARVEGVAEPVDVQSVRRWCGQPDARIVVTPVLDLAADPRVDAYEVPDRFREQVVVRDGTCTFPFCTRSARASDVDHVVPYDHDRPTEGGQTEPSNLVALCRHHHRLKTATVWTSRVVRPGVVEWIGPDGSRHRRDPGGTTTAVPAPRPPDRSTAGPAPPRPEPP